MTKNPYREIRFSGYVVLVVEQYRLRIIGPYSTFNKAFKDAQSWGGMVSPIEKPKKPGRVKNEENNTTIKSGIGDGDHRPRE